MFITSSQAILFDADIVQQGSTILGQATKQQPPKKATERFVKQADRLDYIEKRARLYSGISDQLMFGNDSETIRDSIVEQLSTADGDFFDVTITVDRNLDVTVSVKPAGKAAALENSGNNFDEIPIGSQYLGMGYIKYTERMRVPKSYLNPTLAQLTDIKLRAIARTQDWDADVQDPTEKDVMNREAIKDFNEKVQGGDARLDDKYREQRDRAEGKERTLIS